MKACSELGTAQPKLVVKTITTLFRHGYKFAHVMTIIIINHVMRTHAFSNFSEVLISMCFYSYVRSYRLIPLLM